MAGCRTIVVCCLYHWW